MQASPREVPVDYADLAEFMAALGYAARLELLDLLRFPHTLSEIKLKPHRTAGGSAERTSSRQTIQAHLDKLVEVDLVRAEQVPQPQGRPVNRYVVNPQKLYALLEEMRRLSTIYAGRGPSGDATGTMVAGGAAPEVAGPRLVLMHGVYEGKAFPLTAETATDGRWLVGRRRDVAVSLDYDPFVSLENCALEQRQGAFTVTDLPESKNGTRVNWAPLPKGLPRALRAGDAIGVGRSLLTFIPG